MEKRFFLLSSVFIIGLVSFSPTKAMNKSFFETLVEKLYPWAEGALKECVVRHAITCTTNTLNNPERFIRVDEDNIPLICTKAVYKCYAEEFKNPGFICDTPVDDLARGGIPQEVLCMGVSVCLCCSCRAFEARTHCFSNLLNRVSRGGIAMGGDNKKSN